MDFTLINSWCAKKQLWQSQKANKQVYGKISNSQSIGIIVIKSKETKVVTYSCRYSSGHLIAIIQPCQGLNARWNICSCR